VKHGISATPSFLEITTKTNEIPPFQRIKHDRYCSDTAPKPPDCASGRRHQATSTRCRVTSHTHRRPSVDRVVIVEWAPAASWDSAIRTRGRSFSSTC